MNTTHVPKLTCRPELPQGFRADLVRIFMICASVFPSLAHGQVQDSGAFNPLRLPTPPYICHRIPPTPKDSAAFVIRMYDGTDPLGQRVSRIAYDSAGGPLYMVMIVPRTISDTAVEKYMRVVQFHPKRSGRSVIVPLTRSSPSSDSVKKEPLIVEDLTELKISNAEALAKWYWEHRCPESPTDQ